MFWHGRPGNVKQRCLSATHQKLIYNKHFDNVLRGLWRGTRNNAEEVAEQEIIREAWSKVIALRENELAEDAVRQQAEEGQEEEAAATPLTQMRKPTSEFVEHSLEYYQALANTTVRRYLSCQVLLTTQGQMQRAVVSSALKDITFAEGQQ